MRGRDQKGWTLVELMAGLVVSSIVTSMVVPAFKDVVDRSRLAVSANQLLTDLTMARQKGVMSGLPTTFCAGDPARGCTGNWSARTWIVFVDRDRDGRLGANDVVLSRADLASETSLTIAGNGPFGSAVVFDPIGTSQLSNGAFAAGTLRLCARGGRGANATDLILAASGRVRAESRDLAGLCPSP